MNLSLKGTSSYFLDNFTQSFQIAPEERVQEYWETYTSLTPYSLPLHRVEQDWSKVVPATPQQWKNWRGKKTHWQEQVAFLNQELDKRNGDTDKLVADYAPELLNGMVGALTHAIIHTGWAIDADSPWMIAEGLAYLNFAHIGLSDSQLVWDKHADDATPMDSLRRVADTWHTEHLSTTWVAKAKSSYDETFHPELVPAGFQWEVAKILDSAHRVATDLPSWISTMDIDVLWENLYRAVLYLFLATRDEQGHGNFIVLHLITSLWGLEKTLTVINKEKTSRKAIAHYYAGLICLLSVSAGGFPRKDVLLDIEKTFPRNDTDPADLDWTNMIKAGITEEEEHNIKLVYAMRELWNRYGHWKGFSEAATSFTLTPVIRSTTEKME
jgi:hypothetical protein